MFNICLRLISGISNWRRRRRWRRILSPWTHKGHKTPLNSSYWTREIRKWRYLRKSSWDRKRAWFGRKRVFQQLFVNFVLARFNVCPTLFWHFCQNRNCETFKFSHFNRFNLLKQSLSIAYFNLSKHSLGNLQICLLYQV